MSRSPKKNELNLPPNQVKPDSAMPAETSVALTPEKADSGIFRAVYRFLASLKLAVISLSSLALLLAYATFFESWYGAEAARAYVYRSPIFYLVNILLFLNILCAATIRYPWKRHQTGFVVTHIGLLTLIVGSFISQKMTDDGQVGLAEGQSTKQLIRDQKPLVRVRVPEKNDQGQLTAMQEYELDLYPGVFPWPAGRAEKVTLPKDPFQLEITGFLPAAKAQFEHEKSQEGRPMIDAHLIINAPNQVEGEDILGDEVGRWLKADTRFGRVARSAGPAIVAFQHLPANDPDLNEKISDFLEPQKLTTADGTARLHYKDKSGKSRFYDWIIDGQPRKETLPESDLTVEFLKTQEGEATLRMPTRLGNDDGMGGSDLLYEATAEPEIAIVRFKVQKDGGRAFDHYGWPDLIQAPSLVPGDASKGGTQLVRINYMRPRPPGTFGYVEVLGAGDGRLFYRVFGREGFRTAAELKKGETVQAFSGGGGMAGRLRVDEYYPSGLEKLVYVPATLPVGQKGIPAIRCNMSVGNESKEFWVRGTADLKPYYQPVVIGAERYEIAYDVDRKELDFEIKLIDFEAAMDPGTQQASSFESRIELTDPEKKVRSKPVLISMNNPMIWRGYTFYQSNYIPEFDESGRQTGEFVSVFQVRHDRVWGITYLGCLIVVLGIFLQFYMKSGPFKARPAKTQQVVQKSPLKTRIKAEPTL
jgi:hypothetical protein